MATVQAAPAAAQQLGSVLPQGLSQQAVQEIYMKFKQMKDSGVSDQDPEYQKVHNMLVAIQQQRMFHKQRQMQQQQQQQQLQQQNANIANAGANGNNAVRPPQQNPTSVQTPPTSQPSSATAQPASSKASAAPPTQAPQRSSTVGSGLFTPDQLGILKHQIFAFKCLSKNLGIPQATQQQLFVSQQTKQPPTNDQLIAAAAKTLEDAQPSVNGKAKDSSAAPEPKEEQEEISTIDPYTLIPSKMSYAKHSVRQGRFLIPSIMPSGVDVDKLREDRERVIYNRMSSRYQELKSIPANMQHWDTRKSDDLSTDDSVKRKALIELKMLEQYSKQRAMRERIARQMIQYDNLAMTANRSMYRRMKKQSLREARITEKLEKEQRDARETREKKKHTDYLQTVLQHGREITNAANVQKLKMQKLGRMMQIQHQNIEKEEQKRIERTAKQRLAALKSNDEEAYLKLLDQAKDTRITHLLKQTDGFLTQLAQSVKAQQRKAAERYGDLGGAFHEEESEEDEDEEQDSDIKKIDYYAVAHRVKEEVTEQASILVGGRLKEYQVKGLQWMISLYNNNLNGILADEMGLGKTIQTISLITYLIETKKQNGPFLVIVPLSTLTNWNLEFEKWAPSVTRIVYKGPPNVRKQQQQQIRYGNFQVLLTTYEYIIKDRPVLSKIKWIHMIIDEGHRMKNANSKLSGTLSQYYSTRYRLILTGTPLQNNLTELWAMLNFVLPNIFKSVKSFDEWFNTPFANTGGQDKMELTEEEQILVIRRLHKVLRPFLLRRLKRDVEKDLPEKSEKVIKTRFSALQSRLYKQMVTHNKLVVSDGKGGKTGARGLSNMIMQLRKLCNHPFVFDEVENQMNPRSQSNDLLWRTSGKFELLDRILPKYQQTGHRVLMFFQMTAIMDIMEDFLRLRGIMYLRLDGTTKSDDRSELLKEFNRPDSPYFMFLLSTRAGGLGLNLQTADTVIIYDSDWNPHQDLQAQDRAHRIGQKNEVRILRLISSNSVEEKILERAKYKLDMDGKVIQAGRFDNKSSETDRDAMLRVMLETAESAESLEQEEMDDDDLNLMLARSDEEVEVFRRMDEIRAKDLTYGTAPGSKRVPRLMADNELPDIYLSEGNPVDDEPEEIRGRGARERKTLHYDDGLTEEQWLNAVDADDDSPEAAAQRKADRKERRRQKKHRKEQGIDNAGDSDTDGTKDSDEEPEPEPEPIIKKPRGRKPVVKVDKRKADEFEEDEKPAPKKPKRGGPGRPKGAAGGGDALTLEQRRTLQTSLRSIYKSLLELEAGSESGSEDEEEGKRPIIGPFMALPPKKVFPDYYELIAKPISMKQIDMKIKKEEYGSLGDLYKDIELLCNNARQYNEDGSLLFLDANAIQAACKSKIQDETADHPELADLDGSSRDGASTAPTTVSGTPAPAPRLKLNFNNYVNGGSSGVQSDDED